MESYLLPISLFCFSFTIALVGISTNLYRINNTLIKQNELLSRPSFKENKEVNQNSASLLEDV